jgi:putative membrane protein
MKIALAILAAAAAPMLAAPTVAAQDHHGPGRGSPTPEQAMGYVMKAGASDLYEIQSSQIALRKSRNQQVRNLATMLISHHRMTTRDVTAAARRERLRPMPPMLEPHQRAMIAVLNRTSRGFDRAFLDQQRTAHDQALQLHMNYSARGDAPALRAAAATAVPIIQRHIARIDAIGVR